MKIFVTCQKDAFNRACDAMQKKYEMGQAMIDACSSKEDILLVMETHASGNYCLYDGEGWELLDEIQAVIDSLDDAHLEKIIALESPSKACFDIIPAIQSLNKEDSLQIEFIGPLLDENIFHNIVLVKNAVPNAMISVSLKRCGCTKKEIRDSIIKVLLNMGVIIKDI